MSANPFLWLISEVIWIYIYVVIAAVIMSWLVGLNVVNARNDLVRAVGNFLYQITEPALAPIRNRLPNMGGIDFSPMIAFLALNVVKILFSALAMQIGLQPQSFLGLLILNI